MPENPIQYTSRTFESILTDINNDPELADKPNWFKRLIAGIGDVASLWNNAAVNNVLLRTAYTRRNVALLLELIDYTMTAQSTATGDILFYLDGSTAFPKTVNQEDLVGYTQGNQSVSSKRFEARSGETIAASSETFTAAVTDILTVARVYTTGEKVRFTTTGTLPAPLSIGTDYYVIYVSDTEIKLATSLTNAYLGIVIDITSTGAGVHTIHMYSFFKTVYQQETKTQQSIATSDGSTEWQNYILPDTNILEDTIQIEINSVTWTKVDTLVDSISTDTHYRVFHESDGGTRIQFGNGTYGKIPEAFVIYATYAVGGGSTSNVTVINKINQYGGNDSDVLGCSNPTSITGGADEQSIEDAKVLAPLLLKARERFVTTEDGETLALNYPGISLAKVIKNFYGILSAKVITIADGGGNPSAGVKTALQTDLIDRSVLESIDVRVVDTTITSTNVTSAGKVLPGYVWATDVKPYFDFAWQLFLSETGQQIKDALRDNGITSTIDLINTIFSTTFTVIDDGNTIQTMVEALQARQIGEDIQLSDAYGFIDSNVPGLDYMTIAAPAFPVVLADDEITTDGTITTSEIP